MDVMDDPPQGRQFNLGGGQAQHVPAVQRGGQIFFRIIQKSLGGSVPPVVPDAAFHFNERAAGQMGKIRLPSPLGMKTVLPQEFRAFQKLP